MVPALGGVTAEISAPPLPLSVPRKPISSLPFNLWTRVERQVACTYLLSNVAQAAAGGSIAAPFNGDGDFPDTFQKIWFRDNAYTYLVFVDQLRRPTGRNARERALRLLRNFTNFTLGYQANPGPLGQGEAWVWPDGSPRPANKVWALPQNDGPALGVLVMKPFADYLIEHGMSAEVKDRLFSPDPGRHTAIRSALDYTETTALDIEADIWEKIWGRHFFNLLVKREALRMGTIFAESPGFTDVPTATRYRRKADELGRYLEGFWHPGYGAAGAIMGMIDAPNDERNYFARKKVTGLDSSVVMGANLIGDTDSSFTLMDDRVLATMAEIEIINERIFGINRRPGAPGIAIGRWPEDPDRAWDGVSHPWIVTTTEFGKAYANIASMRMRRKEIKITGLSLAFYRRLMDEGVRADLQPGTYRAGHPLYEILMDRLIAKGYSFLKVIQAHSYPEGILTEQIHAHVGIMIGPQHLGLSYAGFYLAERALSDAATLRGSAVLPARSPQ